MTTVALLTDTPQSGTIYETDYGASAAIAEITLAGHRVLACAAGPKPRATVRALRDQGTTHLWLCEAVGALSPLLEPGDWLVPDDFIDGTRGQEYTYFTDRAGGYTQQVPPFDPASRDALLAGARQATPRPFARGVYVCVSATRLETPAEAAFWSRAGGHVAGRFLSPALVLARELDMAVAALVVVTRAGGEGGPTLPFPRYEPALAAALDHLGA